MRMRRFGGLIGAACIAVSVTAVGTAGAVPKETRVEECEEGMVLLHKVGNSAWVETGDTKYQLVALDVTASGEELDAKTGELVPFSFSFEKTYGAGKRDTFTCTSEHHESDPETGAFSDTWIVATLRVVQ